MSLRRDRSQRRRCVAGLNNLERLALPLYPVVFVPKSPRRSIVPAVAIALTTALAALTALFWMYVLGVAR